MYTTTSQSVKFCTSNFTPPNPPSIISSNIYGVLKLLIPIFEPISQVEDILIFCRIKSDSQPVSVVSHSSLSFSILRPE